jgi:CTP synthase
LEQEGLKGKLKLLNSLEKTKFHLGICLGMQCAVIEFARNVLNLEDAHTVEIKQSAQNPVIAMMEEQKNISDMGGTMRLGAYPCSIKENTTAHNVYQDTLISERHRHRFEFNNKYLNDFEANGMKASGINPDNNLVEIVEVENHPWFVGVQFHPEYKSTVVHPHPLFVSFVGAAVNH